MLFSHVSRYSSQSWDNIRSYRESIDTFQLRTESSWTIWDFLLTFLVYFKPLFRYDIWWCMIACYVAVVLRSMIYWVVYNRSHDPLMTPNGLFCPWRKTYSYVCCYSIETRGETDRQTDRLDVLYHYNTSFSTHFMHRMGCSWLIALVWLDLDPG